ncbi:MAG: DUF4907 domain-containing protein [Chitinophagales bacterium]|nr:DUF4907 domain-containing protein [Chitinophagales bacterium]
MKTLFFISIFYCSINILHAQQAAPLSPASSQQNSAVINTQFTYKIIDASDKTFGYDLYADSKLVIHQLSIPAMPGNDGFKTKADAEKVAQLVITKMKKGEMPPTVSVEELKKLKVIK